MTSLHALLTYSNKISAQRVQDSGYGVASLAGVHVERVKAGVADGWVIISAQLADTTAEQAQVWLLHTLIAIEGEDEYAQLLHVEIDGERRPITA